MPDTLHIAPFSYQILIKPVGSRCNIKCDYCYYIDKDKIFDHALHIMDIQILEKFTREYINSQQTDSIYFVWHGGEPCLAGLDFYKKAIKLQKKYSGNKKINNIFQTNALLINEEWCDFFSKENFLLGISIDGPKHINDIYRKDKQGNGTYNLLIKKLKLLYDKKVEYNIMAVVNDINVKHSIEFYNSISQLGTSFIQFTPIVERSYTDNKTNKSFLVSPDYKGDCDTANFSINPKEYGKFLCNIYDEWVKKDVGRIFVQLFDNTLASHMNKNSDLCIFQKHCGNTAALEHNGDLFSCDHYVYQDNLIGNIQNNSLIELMLSEKQFAFARKKENELSTKCIKCKFLKYCGGGCPKNRFSISLENEKNNYICEAYKSFFSHVESDMEYMTNELNNKRPPANIMNIK